MSDQDGRGTPARREQPTYAHVHVRLAGRNGDVGTVIEAVAMALYHQVSEEAASAFTLAVFSCDSFDEVLQLAMRTVDVS